MSDTTETQTIEAAIIDPGAPVASVAVADDPTVHPSTKAAHASLLARLEAAVLEIPIEIEASFEAVTAFIKSKL